MNLQDQYLQLRPGSQRICATDVSAPADRRGCGVNTTAETQAAPPAWAGGHLTQVSSPCSCDIPSLMNPWGWGVCTTATCSPKPSLASVTVSSTRCPFPSLRGPGPQRVQPSCLMSRRAHPRHSSWAERDQLGSLSPSRTGALHRVQLLPVAQRPRCIQEARGSRGGAPGLAGRARGACLAYLWEPQACSTPLVSRTAAQTRHPSW